MKLKIIKIPKGLIDPCHISVIEGLLEQQSQMSYQQGREEVLEEIEYYAEQTSCPIHTKGIGCRCCACFGTMALTDLISKLKEDENTN